MTNEELNAIRTIIQQELEPIKADVATLKTDVAQLKIDVSDIKDDLEIVKEDAAITRVAVNALGEWAENVAVVTAITYPVKHKKAE